MQMYAVCLRPARFGAGEVLGLSPAQYQMRAHRLDVVQQLGAGAAEIVVVRLKDQMQFKVGEIVGLVDGPAKSQSDVLVACEMPGPAAASPATSKPAVRSPPKARVRKDGKPPHSPPPAISGQGTSPPSVKTDAGGPGVAAGGDGGAGTGDGADRSGAGTGDGVTGDV